MSHVCMVVGIRKPFPDLSDYTVWHYFSRHSNCLLKESPSSAICTNCAGLPFYVVVILPNTTLAQHSLKLLIKYFLTFIVFRRRCLFCLLGPPLLSMIIMKYACIPFHRYNLSLRFFTELLQTVQMTRKFLEFCCRTCSG